MAHQSLYRRYRPRRFADVRGQEHVIRALRNAVAQGSEGHAYLFSGPRGTGKTSTARILAKALNCPNLSDGEPCGECESCLSIEHGSSYDLFELDAASNNGVDAMRELISRTVVGSPGRTKVYILDEVHMLSPAASNALLKTLEEPPDHVCFVLATTDPQKVLPTIRSRTQHFEFSLLSASELTDYVRWISADAGLGVDDRAVEYVVRQGRGSARDTLSALDMVVAAGGVADRAESIDEILAALADRDTPRMMSAVADAVSQGREPRVLADQLLVSLRDAFLVSVDAHVEHLPDGDRQRMAELAAALGLPTITRALESVGAAIVDMRQAADPRVPLEVALIRLTTPAADTSVAALLERIESLERRLAGGAAPDPASSAAPTGPAPGTVSAPPAASAASAAPPSGPAAVRAQLARDRGNAPARPTSAPPRPSRPRPAAAEPGPAPEGDRAGQVHDAPPATRPVPAPEGDRAAQVHDAPPATPATPPSSPATGGIDLDRLAAVLTSSVIPGLAAMAKSLYGGGRLTGQRDGRVQFALADEVPARLLDRAEQARPAVEAALSEALGQPVRLELTLGGPPASASTASASGAAPSAPPADHHDDEEHVDVTELEDAHDVSTSGVDRLVQAFPGAQLIDEESP